MSKLVTMHAAVIFFFLFSSLLAGGDERASYKKSNDFTIVQNIDYYSSLGIIKAGKKMQAPDFSLKSLDGNEVKLSDFQGKVVFLNFWATWCGPCRAEVKDIDALYHTLKDEDFTVMAVDIKEDKRKIKSFMKKFGIDFPVYLDASGEIAGQWAVTGIPTTYIIAPDGYILGKAVGPRDWGGRKSVDFMRSLMRK